MNTRICKRCGEEKPLTDYYKKRDGYYDTICIQCKKKYRKNRYKDKKFLSEYPETCCKNTGTESIYEEAEKYGDDDIFREYKYPNGKVLRLTKSEFFQVVDVFGLLFQWAKEKKCKEIMEERRKG